MRAKSYTIILILPLLMLLSTLARAEGLPGEERRVTFEYELGTHYTNVAIYACLTDKPIPEVGEIREIEVYKRLLLGALIPRFVNIEASVAPVPLIATYYDTSDFSKAITAGYEEPSAISLFFGSVIRFKRKDEKFKRGNFGYSGYLISIGDMHIKDNVLIDDNWTEIEWKIKGERAFTNHRLKWSFRIGAKLHGNREIMDVYYVGIRRGYLKFEDSTGSIWDNSGFDYRYDMDKYDLSPINHSITLFKNWPLKVNRLKRLGAALEVGFIWEGDKKYSGSLRRGSMDEEEFTWIVRPKLYY